MTVEAVADPRTGDGNSETSVVSSTEQGDTNETDDDSTTATMRPIRTSLQNRRYCHLPYAGSNGGTACIGVRNHYRFKETLLQRINALALFAC